MFIFVADPSPHIFIFGFHPPRNPKWNSHQTFWSIFALALGKLNSRNQKSKSTWLLNCMQFSKDMGVSIMSPIFFRLSV